MSNCGSCNRPMVQVSPSTEPLSNLLWRPARDLAAGDEPGVSKTLIAAAAVGVAALVIFGLAGSRAFHPASKERGAAYYKARRARRKSRS